MYVRRRLPKAHRQGSINWSLFLLILGILAFLVCSSLYLRTVSTQIAISDASDLVSLRINQTIAALMSEEDYGADSFVSFEKGEGGEVTAISCNMTRINALSAEILDRIVGATENYTATVQIPLGNLSGISMLMGRGPMVPIEIVTLTSSRVEFHNGIVTAGINQTKHQITLQIKVDVDILVPWGSESTQVVSELLIADTVIVGRVPDTYVGLEKNEPE